MGPLSGIRVLDLTRVLAAPWASQMLGDLGADVIKVEFPGKGDDARIYGPAWLPDEDGNPGKDSSFFICTNRNKRSITVNFSKPEGQQVIRDLAIKCDVFMENFIAGAMERVGLDFKAMHALNPRLVYCSVTGYGQDGPYASRPGYDAVFQAQSGLMSVTGHPDGAPGGGPMRIGPSLVDVSTGYNAVIGILAALSERDRFSGVGQHIDIALLDVAVAMQSHTVQGYLMTGEVPARCGTVGNGGHPARLFTCQDGDIYISAGNQRQHEALCRVLDVSGVAQEARFLTSPLRFDNRAEWDAIVEPVIAKWDKFELQDALVAAKVPCSVVNDYNDLFADPHVQHRGLKRSVEHPAASDGWIDVVANPLRFSNTPVVAPSCPPMLGQHTDEILLELAGYSPNEIQILRDCGAI